jgi:hypothetical protein
MLPGSNKVLPLSSPFHFGLLPLAYARGELQLPNKVYGLLCSNGIINYIYTAMKLWLHHLAEEKDHIIDSDTTRRAFTEPCNY